MRQAVTACSSPPVSWAWRAAQRSARTDDGDPSTPTTILPRLLGLTMLVLLDRRRGRWVHGVGRGAQRGRVLGPDRRGRCPRSTAALGGRGRQRLERQGRRKGGV